MAGVFIHNFNNYCGRLHRVISSECQIFEFQRYMSVKRRIVEEEIGVEQDIYGFGGT